MNELRDRWISVAKIGKTKGLHGFLRIQFFDMTSELLDEVTSFSAGVSENDLTSLEVFEAAKDGKGWIAQFEGFEDVDAAAELTGKELFVRRSQLPELPKGKFYHCDLLGLRVVDSKGNVLGTLREILSTPANDVFVVGGQHGETLLPAIDGVLMNVDVNEGKIVVNPPEAVDAF